MTSGSRRWKSEIPRALDHFQRTSSVGYESGIDYFQSDTMIELRSLLDEPVGISYFQCFLAETKDIADGEVMLAAWIGLHNYHLLENEANRRIAAKALYRRYISPLSVLIRRLPPGVQEAADQIRESVVQALVQSRLATGGSQLGAGTSEEVPGVPSTFEPTDVRVRRLQEQEAHPQPLLSPVPEGESKEAKLATSTATAATTDTADTQTTGDGLVSEASSSVPTDIFFPLQSALFMEMEPLLERFKDSPLHAEYIAAKREKYNHIEPDDFRWLDLLGKGGFGSVVHVVKKSTGKHYAMKVQTKQALLHAWGDHMELVEIERDVLVANEKFPFIVSLQYAFQSETHAFLALDLVECGSLHTLLDSTPGRMLEAAQVRLYAAEVVLALEVLHEHDIVYRDLKPANVLLRQDGHVRLADMGLAGFYYQTTYPTRRLEEDAPLAARHSILLGEDMASHKYSQADAKLVDEVIDCLDKEHAKHAAAAAEEEKRGEDATSTDATSDQGNGLAVGSANNSRKVAMHKTDCGTPLYRPPEMVKREAYGPAVDFFMLGVFIFELLTGQLPYLPDKILQKMKDNMMAADPSMINLDFDNPEDELAAFKHPLVLPEHMDPRTKALLSKLLQPDPNSRLGGGISGPERNADMQALKQDAFFWGLQGPLATECDWTKVLNEEFEPVYVPAPVDLDAIKGRAYGTFRNVKKAVVKEAVQEARALAKAAGKDAREAARRAAAEFLGAPVEGKLQAYFNNWDYVSREAVLSERAAQELSTSHRGVQSKGSHREGQEQQHSSDPSRTPRAPRKPTQQLSQAIRKMMHVAGPSSRASRSAASSKRESTTHSQGGGMRNGLHAHAHGEDAMLMNRLNIAPSELQSHVQFMRSPPSPMSKAVAEQEAEAETAGGDVGGAASGATTDDRGGDAKELVGVPPLERQPSV